MFQFNDSRLVNETSSGNVSLKRCWYYSNRQIDDQHWSKYNFPLKYQWKQTCLWELRQQTSRLKRTDLIVGKISSLRVRNVWIPERGVCVFTLIKLKTFDDFSTRMLCFCLLQLYFVCKKHQNFCSIRMWNVILLIITQEINLITRPQFPVPDQQLKVHCTQAPENLQATKPRFMINQTIDWLLKPISIERKERKGSDLTKNENPSKFCFLFCFFSQDFGRGFGLFIKSVNSTEDVEKFCQINILATF